MNKEELKYVKTPLSESDFTEDGIKYTIPAKEFFKLISDLQERITNLSSRVNHLEEKVFNINPYDYYC